MKKFISMVMAAAMVVSLVPATAFAANEATFKVVKDQEYTEDSVPADKKVTGNAQVQIKIADIDTEAAIGDTFDIELEFDGAEVGKAYAKNANVAGVSIIDRDGAGATVASAKAKEEVAADDESIVITVKEGVDNWEEDDIIVINLATMGVKLTIDDAGEEATVAVDGDFGTSDAMVFAAVLDYGISVSLKKVAEVAEEETTALEKKLVIESDVDAFVARTAKTEGQKFELKLNSGFEWDPASACDRTNYQITTTSDEDVVVVEVKKAGLTELEIAATDLIIDAVDAKAGDVAKITVKAIKGVCTDDVTIDGVDYKKGDFVPGTFKDTAEAVEAAKVVSEGVALYLTEEDEDAPVIYSGVNVDNYGITDDSDHKALTFTLEESVIGALDVKKAFNITLTEGVFATDVDVQVKAGKVGAGAGTSIVPEDVEADFARAYEKGEQETFEFARKTWDETTKEPFELEVTMTLIAVPGFVGDAVVTLDGAAFESAQEVTVAKFVAPYTVEAQSNDLIIDYRNTEVPTDIVIKEAEAGLWDAGKMTFEFAIDRFDEDAFEGDAVYTVNEDDSDMEIKEAKDGLGFTVDVESDDEAAVVTISDIALYMSRSIAAGAYDLEMGTSAAQKMMTTDALFTTEDGALEDVAKVEVVAGKTAEAYPYYVADFADWDVVDATNDYFAPEKAVVKEGFVNVITAGRDQDDASFTKKVVVPVGESYIVAGEDTITLDVPAYVSAAGYTMLPVRAVAVALGINTNNVLWDQATKTVTILYGQRIITMTVGSKVINVNGSAIPASASVEVVDGRTFLPMRDLATALGVTDITWDAATKTATLNGNK